MIGTLMKVAATVTATQGFNAFVKGTATTVTIYGLVKKGVSKVSNKKKK